MANREHFNNKWGVRIDKEELDRKPHASSVLFFLKNFLETFFLLIGIFYICPTNQLKR